MFGNSGIVFDPSYARSHFRPLTDNAFDLGQSALSFRTAYLGTNLVFKAASAKIIPGATSLLFRDNADANSNLIITDAGLVTARAGLVATTGNVAITAGNLTFAAASAKIIPGATSLLFRNNADSADNLSITNAGLVTVRAGLTVTASGLTVTAGGATITAGNLAMTAGSIIFAATDATITTNSSDGSDNKRLLLLPAGSSSDNWNFTRGASIDITGNEYSGAWGSIWFRGGNNASDFFFVSGSNGSVRYRKADNSEVFLFSMNSGDLTFDSTYGGRIIFGRAVSGITNYREAVAALGSNQGNAASISGDFSDISAADGTKGVIIANGVAGKVRRIFNNGNAVLKIYPPSGGAFVNIGTNNPISIAAYCMCIVMDLSTSSFASTEIPVA